MDALRPAPPRAPFRPAPIGRYAIAVGATVLAVLSQYVVPSAFPATQILYGNLAGDLAIVYGIPVLAFTLLVGTGPLRDWHARMGRATWEGLRWYGLLFLLSLLVIAVLTAVYLAVDPGALQLLSRENPALAQARGNPWFYVGFSFVIGAFEETIFRGWIFGYWRDRGVRWFGPATWTSALFAAVHLYYGTTYGVAAPLVFPTLFLTGFAFAATYTFSGGNLVVPSLLHGANDASAFLTLVAPVAGVVIRLGIVLVGVVIGLVQFVRPPSEPLRPIGGVPVSAPGTPAAGPRP